MNIGGNSCCMESMDLLANHGGRTLSGMERGSGPRTGAQGTIEAFEVVGGTQVAWFMVCGEAIECQGIAKILAQGCDCVGLGIAKAESRFFFGAGYRVYFADDGETLVVLLSGDGKDRQASDS
jgi:hypothetical protein